MKTPRPKFPAFARDLLLGLALLLPSHAGWSQTAAAYVAEGKEALALPDPETARAAFANALGLDPENEEAHLYLALAELLLVAESEAVNAVFAAANAELMIDWSAGVFEADWRGVAEARAEIEEAVGWQYVSAPEGVGGDVLRGMGGTHAMLDYSVATLHLASIDGPGTIRFRVRAEGAGTAYVGLDLSAAEVSGESGLGLGYFEPTDEWSDVERNLPEGTFHLFWRAFTSGPGPLPAVFLDQLEYLPESGPPSPQDDAAGTGPSLANGIDNGDFALSTETTVGLEIDDLDFLDPDFQTGLVQALMGGEFITAIESASGHLELVASPTFLSTLVLDAETSDAVTIDAGDVLMMRAFLEAGLMLCQVGYADNLEVNPTVVNVLGESGALETFQGFLVAFPDLFKKVHPEAAAPAEAAFRRAFEHYEAASALIRARPAETERLFNLSEEQLSDEEAFREEFGRAIAALDAPESLEVPDFETISLNLGAFFDGTTVWRDLLPDFDGDRPIAGSFPDASFNNMIVHPDAAALLERGLRDMGALLDQPARYETLSLDAGWAHSTGLAAESVLVLGTTDDGSKLIVAVVQEGGNWRVDADRRFFLWDRSADEFTRIDLALDGRPLEDVRLAQVSGDGQTLFLALRDPEVLGWDPPVEIPVELSAPLLRAPDFDPSGILMVDERSIFLDVTQPNGGVGHTQCVVHLAQPEDGDGWWETMLELESPRGDRVALSSNSLQTGERPRDTLVFDFGSGSDLDFSGDWTLRLIQSSRCCGQPGIVVEGLEFRFDLAPLALVRRPLVGGPWEILTRTATSGLADLWGIYSLEVSADGRWATFAAQGDDLVAETVGIGPKWMPRVYLLDTDTKAVDLLSSTAATGHLHPGFAPSISASGEHIAFITTAPLVPEDTNLLRDAYRYDRTLEEYELVSVSLSGLTQTNPSGSMVSAVTLSADGGTVAFRSNSATLAEDVPSDWRIAESIFVREVVTGVTELLDDPWEDSHDPVVSPDGRYVYFHSGSVFDPPDQRFVYDRLLDASTLLASASDGSDAWFGLPAQTRTTRIASGAGQAFLKGNFGTLLMHAWGGDGVEPFHVRGSPATYVAMGDVSLVVDHNGATVDLPVRLYPGSDAAPGPVTATFTTSGFTALPWKNYRDDGLSVTLSTAAPAQTLEIPFHSYDFFATPGLFEVRLASVTGPAQMGHPRSTVVSLAPFADPDRYAEWLLVAFPDPSERENPLISGPMVDAEGDGWFNLLEFALGFDPRAFDAGPPLGFHPAGILAPDVFTLRYNTRSGLRYYIEATWDFHNWERYAVEHFDILAANDLGDGIVEMILQWPFPQDWARFYRLRIESVD